MWADVLKQSPLALPACVHFGCSSISQVHWVVIEWLLSRRTIGTWKLGFTPIIWGLLSSLELHAHALKLSDLLQTELSKESINPETTVPCIQIQRVWLRHSHAVIHKLSLDSTRSQHAQQRQLNGQISFTAPAPTNRNKKHNWNKMNLLLKTSKTESMALWARSCIHLGKMCKMVFQHCSPLCSQISNRKAGCSEKDCLEFAGASNTGNFKEPVRKTYVKNRLQRDDPSLWRRNRLNASSSQP